jgi:large subunit ribosomal protein L25
MAKEVLKVEEREIKTKSYLKNLKKFGKIPAVYYRQGRKAIPITLDQHDFKMMISHRTNLFDLDFGKGKKRQSIIRELQYDPISNEIIHVDLMGIAASEKVIIKVPIKLIGTAIGVKEEGGILEHSNRELEIECLPKDMPTSIEVDVNNLRVNENIVVKDIHLENVSIVSDAEMLIAQVLPPRIEKEVIEVEELEEEAAEPEVITAKEEEEEQE